MGNHGLGFTVLQDIIHLILFEHDIEADGYKSQLHGSIETDHKLRAIVHEKCDAVALIESEGAEPGGSPVYIF